MTEVWVKTEPTLDGSGYMVTLSVGEDDVVALTPERAFLYARGVLSAVNRADYDSAVVRQMRKVLGTGAEAMVNIAQLIRDLRADRPPLDEALTEPLRFEPGVNQSHKGFLGIYHRDEQLGTWGLKAARAHALHVVEAVESADLDAAYLRCLTGLVGIEPARARNVIDDLGKFRV